MASPTCSVDSRGTSSCLSLNQRSVLSLQLEASKWTEKRSRRKFGTRQDKSGTELSHPRTTAEQLEPCLSMTSRSQVRCERRCQPQTPLDVTWMCFVFYNRKRYLDVYFWCKLVPRCSCTMVSDTDRPKSLPKPDPRSVCTIF